MKEFKDRSEGNQGNQSYYPILLSQYPMRGILVLGDKDEHQIDWTLLPQGVVLIKIENSIPVVHNTWLVSFLILTNFRLPKTLGPRGGKLPIITSSSHLIFQMISPNAVNQSQVNENKNTHQTLHGYEIWRSILFSDTIKSYLLPHIFVTELLILLWDDFGTE